LRWPNSRRISVTPAVLFRRLLHVTGMSGSRPSNAVALNSAKRALHGLLSAH
jgi:hypothetical protein